MKEHNLSLGIFLVIKFILNQMKEIISHHCHKIIIGIYDYELEIH